MDIIFIGAYPVLVPPEERLIAEAFSNADPSAAERELSGLALVELEIGDPNSEFNLTLVHQEHSEWAPWEEGYYDANSLEKFSTNRPAALRFRVAFFLHFYVPGRALITPWGNVACGKITALPAHLRRQRYMYWR